MEIDEIYRDMDPTDKASVKKALWKMQSVSEYDMQFFLVKRDTSGTLSQDTRGKIALVQIEMSRRASLRLTLLSIITTVLSGILGILGVVIGVVLTIKYGAQVNLLY
ncbi:hypothetical protein [Cohaesibacter marisflavi]|uniref:hypothetical protein n=1 Tax=Cohaesibacter marisflavi TaxID=655353 RepID=UPI0011139F45|nr:hypothetical protein [Cohaesibacter marisflavi]